MTPMKAMARLALTAAAAAALAAGARGAEKAGYGDKETCISCHEDQGKGFGSTFHGRKSLSSGKLTDDCESCHGPGAAHNEAGDPAKIINPRKLGAASLNKLCLDCHKNDALMLWQTGAHAQNNVSCLTCHSVHEGQGRKSLIDGATDTCLKCHAKQRADMRLASHHPVPEGKMTCASCHNPHGGVKGNLKADSEQELCAKCHTEKVGPFAAEHPPVSDSCANCHVVHGSANDRLLKQPSQYLCLSCHRRGHGPISSTSTKATFTQRSRCTNCHREIHGSDRTDKWVR